MPGRGLWAGYNARGHQGNDNFPVSQEINQQSEKSLSFKIPQNLGSERPGFGNHDQCHLKIMTIEGSFIL